jgi:DNA polymerase III delta subunit
MTGARWKRYNISMFYLIYGTDVEKSREKSRALFEALREKKPDASSGSMRGEEVTLDRITELTQTQGLFENKQIVFMDRTLESPDSRELVVDRIQEIAESPNIFIFFEGKLTKEVLKKLEKRAEKIQEYILEDAKPAEKSSFFPMADALGARDKKKLWILLRDALDKDAAAEELHGILFWQAKSMALAVRSSSAAAAGLNPFVYGKAKRYADNWKDTELDALLSKLVHMYHRAHRGKTNFAIELEKLALDL